MERGIEVARRPRLGTDGQAQAVEVMTDGAGAWPGQVR